MQFTSTESGDIWIQRYELSWHSTCPWIVKERSRFTMLPVEISRDMALCRVQGTYFQFLRWSSLDMYWGGDGLQCSNWAVLLCLESLY
uniref:Uncharacterized protein MANES_09G118400 n=1 Tax=Rhizophora mucronata TaxID=61149 RepID=A0A2P2MBH9_RHIMU